MYYDWTYILVLIGVIISLAASANVKNTFRKYNRVYNRYGITGAQAAAEILRGAGIYDVPVQRISGSLTDNYSPGEKVLHLSDAVYGSTSVAAIGVAAHECGHAIQDQVGYLPLTIRRAAVPICNFGSKLSWPLIIIGLLLGFTPLAELGIILFLFVVAFQLITLPVEFDASARAMRVLADDGMLDETELSGARKVLTAAALTYVAALLTSILQVLRLMLIVSGRRSRR